MDEGLFAPWLTFFSHTQLRISCLCLGNGTARGGLSLPTSVSNSDNPHPNTPTGQLDLDSSSVETLFRAAANHHTKPKRLHCLGLLRSCRCWHYKEGAVSGSKL